MFSLVLGARTSRPHTERSSLMSFEQRQHRVQERAVRASRSVRTGRPRSQHKVDLKLS